MDDDEIFVGDPMKVYLAEIAKVPALTREEEIRCIQHVRAGDPEAHAAKKRLMEAHLHLVIEIAERYRKSDIHFLDLVQKGNEGLMQALQNPGEDAEVSFAEQAAPHIEKAIREIIASPPV